MAALEIAQTLLGLSKAVDCKWEEDEAEAGATDRQSAEKRTDSAAPQHDEMADDDPANGNAKKSSRKGVRRTRRTLNALNNFYLRADELQAFKREYGHCNVPQTYPQNQPLANW